MDSVLRIIYIIYQYLFLTKAFIFHSALNSYLTGGWIASSIKLKNQKGLSNSWAEKAL
jgi:hypothetical protein